MPDELRHDAVTGSLHVGAGVVENVTAEMWRYEVSGVRVLTKWFSYRRRSRERPTMGRRVSKLQEIQAECWLPEYTRELIDLLNVLGLLVKLEPRQAEILDRVLAGPLLDASMLGPDGPNGGKGTSPAEADTIPMF